MNVYVYFKIRDPDNRTTSASRRGDLCYIYPIVDSKGVLHHQGNLTLDSHRAIIMDLIIPCGNDFLDLIYKCEGCPWHDPAQCDVRKYTRAIWSKGSVLAMPKVVNKNRYHINFREIQKIYGSVINTGISRLSLGAKKNEFRKATNKKKLKSILIDRVIK